MKVHAHDEQSRYARCAEENLIKSQELVAVLCELDVVEDVTAVGVGGVGSVELVGGNQSGNHNAFILRPLLHLAMSKKSIPIEKTFSLTSEASDLSWPESAFLMHFL